MENEKAIKVLPIAEMDLIRSISIFTDLDTTELNLILNMSKEMFLEPGEYLVRQGDISSTMSVILSGEAKVYSDGMLIQSMKIIGGRLIGEGSFFTREPYTADAIVVTKMKILRFDYETLQALLEKNPRLGFKVSRRISMEVMEKFKAVRKELGFLVFGYGSKQVAHDIRSPLAALRTLASQAQWRSQEDHDLLEMVIGRLDRLASTLLGSGSGDDRPNIQLEENTHPITCGNDLSRIIDNILEEKKAQYGSQTHLNLKFIHSVASQSFAKTHLRIDRLGFERVLSNLIDNALQAIESSGTVEVSLDCNDSSLILRVKDNGKGIPADLVKKLGHSRITFDKQGGNGLDLLHASQEVRRWGGSLQIDSELKKGAVITICVPAV